MAPPRLASFTLCTGTKMNCTLILPAAGKSSRMRGADKLLEEVAGQPCLRTMALRGLKAGLAVVVTLPGSDHPRAAALAEVPVRRLPVKDADLGMAHSLRAAIAALPVTCEAALILPPDMPGILSEDLTGLVAEAQANPQALVMQAATEDGTPGHPVLFRRALFADFANLTGDQGAREIIADHAKSRLLVPLKGNRARLDLDTPEDWAAWRAGQAAP